MQVAPMTNWNITCLFLRFFTPTVKTLWSKLVIICFLALRLCWMEPQKESVKLQSSYHSLQSMKRHLKRHTVSQSSTFDIVSLSERVVFFNARGFFFVLWFFVCPSSLERVPDGHYTHGQAWVQSEYHLPWPDPRIRCYVGTTCLFSII